jgi:hypothetical protein
MGRAKWNGLLAAATSTLSLAGVLLLVAGVATAAGAEPKAGGLYAGTAPHCVSPPADLTCTLQLQVSSNGRSMTFAGKHNVVSTWACHGGGGEAILGPYAKPEQGQPVPSLAIAAGGAFSGKQTFGLGQAKGAVVASGRFTGTGSTATIEFTLNPGPHSCTNGPTKLTLG